MSFTRRTFLIGAGSGAVAVLLAACEPESPPPTPTPTRTTPSEVPPPAAFARSSWTTDPFSMGAVSFTAVGASPSDRQTLAGPVAERVFFAGEATSVERPGSVTGAWRSGERVAGEVAAVAAAGERIAVVGAGIAGAEAARRLVELGYDITVIEARDRIGGRVYSANSDDWPIPVQFGAWRLGPDDRDLSAHLTVLGIPTIDLEGESYRSRDAMTEVNEVGPAAVAAATAWAAEQPRDFSLADALVESGAGEQAVNTDGDIPGAALLQQYLATVTASVGGPVDSVSSWYPPDLPAELSGAVGDLDEMVAAQLDGIQISLSTAVVGVAYGDDGVSLRLGTGESLSVDRVVLTVPLGVLQQDAIEFEPRLPFDHRAAIARLGVGTIETVWLRFEEPFWTTDAAVWHLADDEHDLRTWYNLEPSTGEPVLVGIVGGAPARRVAELDDDVLSQQAVDALAAFAR